MKALFRPLCLTLACTICHADIEHRPPFRLAGQETTQAYTSHLLAAFESRSEREDPEAFEQRILRLISAYPHEVNDIAASEGIAFTPLMYAIQTGRATLVQALLEHGAIPFHLRGDRDLLDYTQQFCSQEISPEITRLVKEAQKTYNLLAIIARSRSEKN